MAELKKLWIQISRASAVLRVLHGLGIALPALIAAWTTLEAIADKMPRAVVITLAIVSLGAAILAVNQAKQLLGVPVVVRSLEPLTNGLMVDGIEMGFNPAHIDAALQFSLVIRNCARSSMFFDVRRLNVVVGTTTLPDKSYLTTRITLPLTATRRYRDPAFTLDQIRPLLGSIHKGALEAEIAYGRLGEEPTRLYRAKFRLTVSLQDAWGVADVIESEEDSPYVPVNA